MKHGVGPMFKRGVHLCSYTHTPESDCIDTLGQPVF